jgi:WhiB family redox-sensing transcriptional regulator
MEEAADYIPHFIGLPMLQFPDADDSWRDLSACLNGSVDFFDYKQRAAQIALCNTCPVWDHCLEFALRNEEKDGVWGGHTPDERKVIVKQRKKEALSHVA